MKELMIMNSNNEVTMTSKQIEGVIKAIPNVTDKRHADIMRDIDVMFDDLEYNADLRSTKKGTYVASNGKTNPLYILNEDEVMCLVTGYSSVIRMNMIKEFRKLKEKIQLSIPQNFEEAMLLGIKLHKENEKLKEQALLDAPKVTFADLVVESDNSIPIGDWAKLLTHANEVKVGPNKLFSLLRQLKYLMVGRDKTERNKPYQKYIEAGYFEIRYIKTNRGLMPQPLITSLGQLELSDMVVNYFK